MIKTCVEISGGKVIQRWYYSDQDRQENYFESKEKAEDYEKEIAYWALKTDEEKAKLRRLFQNDNEAWDKFTSVSHWAFIKSL